MKRQIVLLVCMILLGWGPWQTSAATPLTLPVPQPRSTQGAAGYIADVLGDADQLYIAGSLTGTGPVTGPLIRTNSAGDLLPFPNQINGTILTMIPDGAGGWFVGGNFEVYGTTITDPAHVRSDHTIDAAWQASVNGLVYALALHQGILYIGGSFSTVNGFSQNNLSMARLRLVAPNLSPSEA